jgi:hypothetical protein
MSFQNALRQSVIDPTRTISFERDVYGPDHPGIFVCLYDPVNLLRGENPNEIIDGPFETKAEAEAFAREVFA